MPSVTHPVSGVSETQQAREYWRQALDGLGHDSALVSLRSGTPVDRSRQEHIRVDLPRETTSALHNAALVLACPLASLVCAAWALCLNRIADDGDIAFLALCSGRPADSSHSPLGSGALVHSVPLRLHVDRSMSLREFAASAVTAWGANQPHAFAPLVDIKAWTGLNAREWDSNIRFDHNRFEDASARPALPGEQRSVRMHDYSDVPLTVAIASGPSLAIHMQYWVDAFRPGAIEGLAESLAALLAGIAENPARRLCDLPYLTQRQRHFINEAASGQGFANDTFDADGERTGTGSTLHAAFERQAALEPGRIAIQWADGCLSYGALNQAADALAANLRAAGVKCEEPVAVLIERSACHLVAALAVMKAGGAYLPLDPAHPDARLQKIMAATSRRCLVSADLAGRLSSATLDITVINAAHLDAPARTLPLPPVAGTQLAYMIATSGTTGEPKIVEIEHRAAANTLRFSLEKIYAPGDLALVPWTDSVAADAGVHQIFAPLSAGGTLLPCEGMEQLKYLPSFDALTTFGSTPSMLNALLAHGGLPPRLKAVMFGGEACPPELPRVLTASTGIRRAVNVYGPTEASIYCTADDVMKESGASGTSRIIGRPIANMRVELFDAALEPSVPGAMGEICIAGIGLARGYRNLDRETAARFINCTGADGVCRRYYRSGDLGALLPDGRLAFHGRRDRQIKIRGVRVELDAIERVIETGVGVQRALVSVVPDPHRGEQLVAWVQTLAGRPISAEDIQAHVQRSLPAQMVPQHVVPIESVPMTPTGKPDFKALPLPSLARTDYLDSNEQIVSEREEMIADIWAKVLGHDDFTLDDDFFECGGDSLSGMELQLRIGEVLRCRLSAAALAGSWSIRAMAAASYEAEELESLLVLGAERPGRPVFWLTATHYDFTHVRGLDVMRPAYLMGTDEIEIRKQSIREFVDRILERVREIQPDGPYTLGGFCFGSIIAFELAARLNAAGEAVDQIVLLDFRGPSLAARLERRTYHAIRPPARFLRAFVRGNAGGLRARYQHALEQGRAPFPLDLRWRIELVRTFLPSGTVRATLRFIETSHRKRPLLYAFMPGGGWRPWVRGKVVTEKHLDRPTTEMMRVALLALTSAV